MLGPISVKGLKPRFSFTVWVCLGLFLPPKEFVHTKENMRPSACFVCSISWRGPLRIAPVVRRCCNVLICHWMVPPHHTWHSTHEEVFAFVSVEIVNQKKKLNTKCLQCKLDNKESGFSIFFIFLHDSKRYTTHSTVQVQSNSQITDIPLTERQRLKDDYLSTSLRFFNLPLGIGPNDRGSPFKWSSEPLCVCLYLGLNPRPLCS